MCLQTLERNQAVIDPILTPVLEVELERDGQWWWRKWPSPDVLRQHSGEATKRPISGTPHSEPLGWMSSHQFTCLPWASVHSTTLFNFVLCYVKGEGRVVYGLTQGHPTHVICSVMSNSVTPWTVTSVHGILQARILEWVAIAFSRGSSLVRDWTWVNWTRIADRFFTIWATREAPGKVLVATHTCTYETPYGAVKVWMEGGTELDHLVLTDGLLGQLQLLVLDAGQLEPWQGICVELEGVLTFPFIPLKISYFLVPKQSKDSEHVSQ